MSFFDPKVWYDGFQAVLVAPHITAPALALSAVSAWWLRGTIEKGSNSELKERAIALEERLFLAHDKEAAIREKLEYVEIRLNALNASMAKKSHHKPDIRATEIAATISEVMLVSNELSRLLNVAGHDNC